MGIVSSTIFCVISRQALLMTLGSLSSFASLSINNTKILICLCQSLMFLFQSLDLGDLGDRSFYRHVLDTVTVCFLFVFCSLSPLLLVLLPVLFDLSPLSPL